MCTFHRRGGRFRICRHCRAQVAEAPRHFRIAPFVALTKPAFTDRSGPIAAVTWALASSGSQSSPEATSRKHGSKFKNLMALGATQAIDGTFLRHRNGTSEDFREEWLIGGAHCNRGLRIMLLMLYP